MPKLCHRSTRYEVSAAFYNQAIQNERVLHQLKLYIDQKSGVINKHVKDCNTCEYNDGKQCNFEVPEYDTEEATNCTYYQIRKWRTSWETKFIGFTVYCWLSVGSYYIIKNDGI